MFVVFNAFIARDAEERYTPNGKRVVKFGVGTAQYQKEGESTIWVECSVWSTCLDHLIPYLKKGKRVFIGGDIRLDVYYNKQNQPTVRYDLNVKTLEFIPYSRKPEEESPPKENEICACEEVEGVDLNDLPF